jgi:hypothetical protein
MLAPIAPRAPPAATTPVPYRDSLPVLLNPAKVDVAVEHAKSIFGLAAEQLRNIHRLIHLIDLGFFATSLSIRSSALLGEKLNTIHLSAQMEWTSSHHSPGS